MYSFGFLTFFMAQDQHNAWVIKAALGTLEIGIPVLDPANQQGRSASADHDITHQLAEQGDQNSCVVNGFTTIGI